MLSPYRHLAESHQHTNPIDALLIPSWLSALLAVVLGAGVVVGAIFLLYYHGSNLQLLVTQQQESRLSNQVISNSLPANNWISDIPLFVFWAGVGVIAYWFVAALIQALHTVVELRQELEYVHVSRHELIRHAFERLAIRTLALIIWFVYLNFSVHHIMPYAIAVGYAGTAATNWLQGAVLILAGILAAAICLHIHTIFVRFIALKPRLFTH